MNLVSSFTSHLDVLSQSVLIFVVFFVRVRLQIATLHRRLEVGAVEANLEVAQTGLSKLEAVGYGRGVVGRTLQVDGGAVGFR